MERGAFQTEGIAETEALCQEGAFQIERLKLGQCHGNSGSEGKCVRGAAEASGGQMTQDSEMRVKYFGLSLRIIECQLEFKKYVCVCACAHVRVRAHVCCGHCVYLANIPLAEVESRLKGQNGYR